MIDSCSGWKIHPSNTCLQSRMINAPNIKCFWNDMTRFNWVVLEVKQVHYNWLRNRRKQGVRWRLSALTHMVKTKIQTHNSSWDNFLVCLYYLELAYILIWFQLHNNTHWGTFFYYYSSWVVLAIPFVLFFPLLTPLSLYPFICLIPHIINP